MRALDRLASSPCEASRSRRTLTSWTHGILRDLGLRPRKSLGQNFLVEPRVLRLFERATPHSSDVLEVGTGLGVLTCTLSGISRRVLSVELDPVLAGAASRLLDGFDNVHIVNADGVDIAGTARVEGLVSNLPYSAASQVIVKAITNNRIGWMVVMIQKELADKLAARPGSRAYGRLTVVVRLYFDVDVLAAFPPSAFTPRPEVWSSLVKLRRIRRWEEDSGTRLVEMARCLFSYKNKRVSKSLRLCGYMTGGCGLPPRILEGRVRELTPEEVLLLSEHCAG